MFDLIFFVRGNRKRKGNLNKLTLTATNLTQLYIFIIIILQLFTASQASTSEEVPPEASPEEKTCPYYWRQFNNRCFYTKGAAATDTRADAISACEAAGGQLAKILTPEENVFMRRILQTYNPTWVGAEQPKIHNHGHGHTDKDHGHMRGQPTHWSDGTVMNYTNFKIKEPEEDDPKCTDDCCGLTVDKNGDWKFKSCESVQEYICEIDLGYSAPDRVHPRTTTTMTPMTTTPEVITTRPMAVPVPPEPAKVVTPRTGKKIELADEQVKTTAATTNSKPSTGSAGSLSSGTQNILNLLIVVLVIKILNVE